MQARLAKKCVTRLRAVNRFGQCRRTGGVAGGCWLVARKEGRVAGGEWLVAGEEEGVSRSMKWLPLDFLENPGCAGATLGFGISVLAPFQLPRK
jgi:hypothetical protein